MGLLLPVIPVLAHSPNVAGTTLPTNAGSRRLRWNALGGGTSRIEVADDETPPSRKPTGRLASGSSVLESDSGVIYEVFPDGTRQVVKSTVPHSAVTPGEKRVLR